MPTVTFQQAIELAIQEHQAGRLDQAETIYRQILQQQPELPEVLHLLGVLTHQRGNPAAAADLIQRAIYGNPAAALYHSHLATVLLALNQVDSAIASARRAIELQPDLAEARFVLGRILQAQGNDLEAIPAYRAAIGLRPDDADAHNNLGSILLQQGALEEASNSLQMAIRLRPDLAEAHNNLGTLLLQQGQVEQSIAELQIAMRLNPQLPEVYNNLGNSLKQAGQCDLATEAYQRAIQLRPTYPDAYNNLGTLRMEQAMLDESIAAYRQAIALRPDEPSFHSNLIFTMQFHANITQEQLAAEQAQWRRIHADPLGPLIKPHANPRDPDRPLRVGFVSPDFRDHSQSFFTLPLLSNLDRSQFQVYCYDDARRHDAITERLKNHANQWRRIVGLSDDSVADLVRADAIDILVDLTLHMERNRLRVFARKPAPVQATWLGYPGSTGLTDIDYRISDPHLDPPGLNDHFYSEQTVRLPDSFWCYDPLSDEPPVQPPPGAAGSLTFGAMNNFCKVNDRVLDLCAKVMQAVPGSRLIILSPDGQHRAQLLENLQSKGIASPRIEFAGRRPRQQYLELYHRIDIGLDTFPYNGHTTTMDALWMGVPVVSLYGQQAVSRGGLSVLSNISLHELIARTPEQYVEIAHSLASDLAKLSELRATMRQRMRLSPLMDAPRFARNMEAALRSMWRQWCG